MHPPVSAVSRLLPDGVGGIFPEDRLRAHAGTASPAPQLWLVLAGREAKGKIQKQRKEREEERKKKKRDKEGNVEAERERQRKTKTEAAESQLSTCWESRDIERI